MESKGRGDVKSQSRWRHNTSVKQ